ncbi:hypothetical protein LCGC14_2228590 [marine sediment metagenome]|uniref:Uncharacterized protein n=1 Tax=marine sediment metagenome TaxID=412755 RepID=A0A0F9D8V0_9ZZZZ
MVEYIDGNTIYKQNSGENVSPVFSSYGSLADKLIVFIRNDPRKYICGVSTISPVDVSGAGITPDLTTGDKTNLFFVADNETDANSGLYYRNDGSFYVEIEFKAIIKTGTTISKTNIATWVSSNSSKFSQQEISNPAFCQLWDYTNTTWRDFKKHKFNERSLDDSAGTGNSDSSFATSEKTRRFSINFEKEIETGVIADYSSVSAANTYGWKTHTFKIRFFTGESTQTRRELLHFFKSQLTIDMETDQGYQVGVGKIQTVNDHNLVLYGNAAVSCVELSAKTYASDSVVILVHFVTSKVSGVPIAIVFL